ncbi:hypothetical protein OGAPHI_003960 [Ogataea philodendri]|uniref:Uncharacterized protein n=1 Tax=Ogataea philodendri TaxID=1378263 RepID=A0A9P8P6E7_9ASCO|nr:uncharacterized protein OGAPHI_003960 [Ogataea philodendri]KAH3665772.1 hypothetical protein OGAPHI_003960 [Ogataea philodendri]
MVCNGPATLERECVETVEIIVLRTATLKEDWEGIKLNRFERAETRELTLIWDLSLESTSSGTTGIFCNCVKTGSNCCSNDTSNSLLRISIRWRRRLKVGSKAVSLNLARSWLDSSTFVSNSCLFSWSAKASKLALYSVLSSKSSAAAYSTAHSPTNLSETIVNMVFERKGLQVLMVEMYALKNFLWC